MMKKSNWNDQSINLSIFTYKGLERSKMEKRKITEKLLPIPGHSTFINKVEDIDDLKVLFCICETKISVVMRPFNQTKFCILHKLITAEKHPYKVHYSNRVLSHGDFSRLVWLKAFCRIYSGFRKYSDPLKLFKFVSAATCKNQGISFSSFMHTTHPIMKITDLHVVFFADILQNKH